MWQNKSGLPNLQYAAQLGDVKLHCHSNNKQTNKNYHDMLQVFQGLSVNFANSGQLNNIDFNCFSIKTEGMILCEY